MLSLKDDYAFWQELACDDPAAALARWEPQDGQTMANDAYIDRLADAFAGVVDAKSPWTFRHSARVAEVATCMAREFGVDEPLRRDIRRAGLLHDIGKLGVSSLILDKPGELTQDEWIQLRRHAFYSQQILAQLPAFALLSDVASAHHERLDGRGYHRGLPAERLHWVSRLLAVADIYEALSANRPYRAGMPWEKIQSILREERGRGLDADCVDALQRCHEPFTAQTRTESQLEQLDKLLSEAAAI
jgi:putative nucleotidyltransferase with HDIG domain